MTNEPVIPLADQPAPDSPSPPPSAESAEDENHALAEAVGDLLAALRPERSPFR